MNLNLKFNSFIEDICCTLDVRLTSDEIIVLSLRNPCVSLYTYSHQLIREIIPRREGNPVLLPTCLLLDSSSNILITDFEAHCVCVFSFGGELIHRFGKDGEMRGDFIEPSGIAIDVEGRILVASYNPEHCIDVFLILTDTLCLTFLFFIHISYSILFMFLLLQTFCSDTIPFHCLSRISVYVHIGYLNLQHFMTYHDMPAQCMISSLVI